VYHNEKEFIEGYIIKDKRCH